jgi:hypothetical protein
MDNSEIALIQERERRRIIGKLLEKVGIYRLAGQEQVANAIDVLAMEIEVEPTIRQLREREDD